MPQHLFAGSLSVLRGISLTRPSESHTGCTQNMQGPSTEGTHWVINTAA